MRPYIHQALAAGLAAPLALLPMRSGLAQSAGRFGPGLGKRPHPALATGSGPRRGDGMGALLRRLQPVVLREGAPVNVAAISPDGGLAMTASCKDGPAGPASLWDLRAGTRLRVLQGHANFIESAAWNRDGSLAMTAGLDKTVILRDGRTGEPLHRLPNEAGWIHAVAWSPDGARLTTVDEAHDVLIWEAPSGRQALRLKGHSAMVFSASWSPDSSRLATASADGTVRLWNALTGESEGILAGPREGQPHIRATRARFAAFSPDGGKVLTTGFNDHRVILWDARTGEELRRFIGHDLPIPVGYFHPAGDRILSADAGRRIILWDARTGRPLRELLHSADLISSLWSPDGAKIAHANPDHTVSILEDGTYRKLLSLKGPTKPIRTLSWSPDGTQVIAGGSDGTAKVWKLEFSKEELSRLEREIRRGKPASKARRRESGEAMNPAAQPSKRFRVRWSSSFGHAPAAGGRRPRPKTADPARDAATGWALSGRFGPVVLQGHKDAVTHVAFSPDGSRLATASKDETVILWETRTGRRLRSFGTGVMARSCSFSSGGDALLAVHLNGGVSVWDLRTGRRRAAFNTDGRVSVESAWFSPDGRRVITAGAHASTQWDARTGSKLQTLAGSLAHRDPASVSPDGSKRARLDPPAGTATIYKLPDETPLHVLTPSDPIGIRWFSWSPDGTRIATSNGDNSVTIWDSRSGRRLKNLRVHDRHVTWVGFSPDGSLLAATSFDGTVALWDSKSGRLLRRLDAGGDWVSHAAFSPDGSRLAAAGWDDTARIWTIAPAREELAGLERDLSRGIETPPSGPGTGNPAPKRFKVRWTAGFARRHDGTPGVQ